MAERYRLFGAFRRAGRRERLPKFDGKLASFIDANARVEVVVVEESKAADAAIENVQAAVAERRED